MVSGVYGERRKVYARRKLTDILLYKGCDGTPETINSLLGRLWKAPVMYISSEIRLRSLTRAFVVCCELMVSGVYGERRKVYARRKLTDILLYKGCDGSIFI
jgi:hypothetical protein